jgi:alcohol dehydrogenase class IV
MPFEFATATRIIFGRGSISRVGDLAAELGRHALLVIGQSRQRVQSVVEALESREVKVTTFQVTKEPTIGSVADGVDRARSYHCDTVVAVGGGSALDCGKAIAALLTNGGDLADYLEVIGRGQPLTEPSAPFMAIPTTAGTGAEVTRNAVLDVPDHHVKVSLRSPKMLPRVALIDPELTHTLPPSITASTGLDALTQVIEPFVSGQANPLTDGLCREAMEQARKALPAVYEDGTNALAREKMSLVSLFGGLALANAKLGAVHGFAGPFGGMFPAPHGATCAALLPHVMAINIAALEAREPDNPARHRYDEVAQILTGERTATAADGVNWVRDLCKKLNIAPLRTYGLTENDFPTLLEKARRASSMKGNPIRLTDGELQQILLAAC